MPVVFDPDAARAILGLLAGCVNGNAIWRRSSYLVDRLGTKVASGGKDDGYTKSSNQRRR